MDHFFNWLKDSGTQALLVLIGTFAALAAAYFGWKAPSRRDLKRVEDNTAHLEEMRERIVNLDVRTKRQEDVAALANRANSVSITVNGEADAGQPLSMYLTGTEPNIHFTRVEFRSELGNVFGTSECTATGNLFQYIARLPASNLANWRNAGTGLTIHATRHVLRVWCRFDERDTEVSREMAVTLNQGSRVVDGNVSNLIATYKVEGRV